MSLILELLKRQNIIYKKTGSNYVCRCPICKGDHKLKDHNAQININTNTIYCYSEQKLYTYAELLKELTGKDYSQIIAKRKESAKLNTERTKNELKEFEKVKSSLIELGYHVSAVYEYYDINGKLAYERYRFERNKEDGSKEKILIPCSPDGYASLKGQKQIPYRLDQFLYVNSNEIWLCEGEKCTDAVVANMPDSANLIVLGFAKPSDFEGFEHLFKDKEIVIFQDNDSTGKKNTKDLVELFKTHAKSIKVVKFSEFSQGYDIADYLENHSWNELIERTVENAEVVYQSPVLQLCQGIIETEKEENFILEPFIPNKSIVLFDGLGESGKSILAMQMSLSVSAGINFLCNSVQKQGKIIYFTAEETEPAFNARLSKIVKSFNLTNIENFYWISVLSKRFQCSTYRLLENTKKGIEKTEFFIYLKTIIEQIRPVIVVLDSLVNFYGLEENSSEHASVFVETLKLLSRDYNCSFLLLHHQTKESMRKEGEKVFRGSMIFREQARCRIMVEKVNNDIKKIQIEKLNQHTTKPREYFVKLTTINENLEPCLCFIPTDPPQQQTYVQKRKNGKKDEIEEVF